MTEISGLADLQSRFDAAKQESALTLSAATNTVATLTTFLATLPGEQIALTNASTVLVDQASKLIVSGDADEKWDIPGTNWEVVHITWVELTFTQVSGEFPLQIVAKGSITIGTRQIDVIGSLGAGNQLNFTLQNQSGGSLSLVDVAGYISHNTMTHYIPAGVENFGTVPLSALSFSFGYKRASITTFSFTTQVSGDWPIITGWASLRQIVVTLVTRYGYQPSRGYTRSLIGSIQAKLDLGQDFDVRLTLQGPDYWEVEVIPQDGNLLPGLSALAGLAGPNEQDKVQKGLNTLGLTSVSIDAVTISFSIAEKRLRSITIWADVEIDSLIFNIQIALPNFTFFGSLDSATPIHLKALAAKYFGSGDEFPEVEITRLGVGVDTSTGSYNFSASIMSDWDLHVGEIVLGFHTFGLDILKGKDGITGTIIASFTLANITFGVFADRASVADGWDFRGSTVSGDAIPLGTLISDLASAFGVDTAIPSPIADLSIRDIRVKFNTKSGNFTFDCEALFPVGDKKIDIVVSIVLTKDTAGNYTKNITGRITVGELEFDLHFLQDPTATLFVGTYLPLGSPQELTIKSLVAEVSSEVAEFIPESLAIKLKEAQFAYNKDAAGSTFLFGLDIDVTNLPQLSALPVVGKLLPSQATMSLNDLRVLVASQIVPKDLLAKFNTLLPDKAPRLPAQADLPKGPTVSATLDLGGTARALTVPVIQETQQTQAVSQTTTQQPAVTSPDTAKWVVVHKSFGPVSFNRVGLQYQDGKLTFLLDAALTAAGLTLSLEGLGFGSSLSDFKPTFTLRGLGVQYANPPVEIAGGFLRMGEEEYGGVAKIKTPDFTLAAFGAYKSLNGHPSIFVYAVLDYPIGGPAFFFVTGLAAGFGYNRALVAPTLDKLPDFPLIAAAKPPASTQPATSSIPSVSTQPATSKDPVQMLAELGKAVPPTIGEYFLALGVRFTSFKLIEGFALLTATFGHRFELGLLGLATLTAPPREDNNPVSPLAQVQLAIRGSFIPDEGFLGINAQLTPASYILSRDCHLTGGYAFYTWFDGPNAGDFVQTLGGYAGSFSPLPAHYPRVPRLAMNWQVNNELSIKGSAYFALTPSMLMAGGALQINWASGDFKAWCNVTADFMVGWKPFHYDIKVRINVGASYTLTTGLGSNTFSGELSTDLHIWGPDFSGTLHVDLTVISFDVKFGSSSSSSPPPLSWGDGDKSFTKSFLHDQGVTTISLAGGLIGETQTPGNNSQSSRPETAWIVNPKDLRLVTNSLIPSTCGIVNGADKYKRDPNVGVAPMNLGPAHVSTTQEITITYKDETTGADVPCQEYFVFTPVLKQFPAALWGQSMTPDQSSLRKPSLIGPNLAGFEIRPGRQSGEGQAKAVKASETIEVPRGSLQFSSIHGGNYTWGTSGTAFKASTDKDAARRETIKNTITAEAVTAARHAVLAALEFPADAVALNSGLVAQFEIPPQVRA